MTNNELLLFDRVEMIKSTLKGKEDLCYISFSCVIDKLIDLALPNNEISRV